MAMTEEKNRKISSRSMMGRHTGTTSRMLVHTVVVMVAFVALSSSSSPPPSLFLNGNQQLFLLPLLVDGFVLSPTTPRVSLHQCDLLDCKHQHRHHHVHSLHQKKKEWQHSKPWLSQQQPGKRTTRTSNTQHNSIIAGGILEAVDTLWKANPFAAAAIVCGFKASAADFVAQKRQNRKKSTKQPLTTEAEQVEEGNEGSSEASSRFDRRRNLGFLIYGSAYQGVGQEYIYNTLYPIMFGTGGDPITVVKMVCFDLFIQTTFITLPIAYYFKSIIFGTSFIQSTKQYLSDVRHQGLLTKYFMLWGPVQALTFGVIPHHFRITFIAMVSFFWVIILSSISGRQQSSENPPASDTAVVVKEDLPASSINTTETTTTTTTLAKTADLEMVPPEI